LKNQEDNQYISPPAEDGSLEGEVVATILGDEAEILGFPPTTHGIIRIPETRHKISKKHPVEHLLEATCGDIPPS
jgi:hypothetical protein